MRQCVSIKGLWSRIMVYRTVSCLTTKIESKFHLSNENNENSGRENQFKFAWYDDSYIVFFGRLIAKCLRQVAESWATCAQLQCWKLSVSHTVLKLSVSRWPFCVALSTSVVWHARFYIAALSIIFFLEFSQWRSRCDRFLTWISYFHYFQAPGVGLKAQTWPYRRACRMGNNCS